MYNMWWSCDLSTFQVLSKWHFMERWYYHVWDHVPSINQLWRILCSTSGLLDPWPQNGKGSYVSCERGPSNSNIILSLTENSRTVTYWPWQFSCTVSILHLVTALHQFERGKTFSSSIMAHSVSELRGFVTFTIEILWRCCRYHVVSINKIWRFYDPSTPLWPWSFAMFKMWTATLQANMCLVA